jgi:hypothetical protein
MPYVRRTVVANLAIALLVCAVASAQDVRQIEELQAEEAVRYDGHSVLRIDIRSTRELRTILALTDDVWSHRIGVGGPVDVRVSPEQFAAVVDAGLQFEIFIADLQAQIDQERAQIEARRQLDTPWFENYHPWADIRDYVQDLAAQYPNLASYEIIGMSLEGRDIFAIRITGNNMSGTGTPPGQRPIIFFNGCQHAREWVSPATVVYIADRLLRNYTSDPRIQTIMDNVEFIIVPVVNPDGYIFSWTTDRLWRKNRAVNPGSTCRGVDPNRNWGYEWGGEGASTNPCNQTFRGPAAFSEPETQVIRDYITANPRIGAAIDFHSYSELILSPWGWTNTLPPGHETFDLLNAAMQAAIASVHGKIYAAGPSYTTIYPASGVMPDWTWGGRGILGWTIELRDRGQFGFVLPPEQIIPTAEENLEGVHALAEYFLPIRFTRAALAPASVLAQAATPVSIGIDSGSATLLPGSARLRTRSTASGSFLSLPMAPLAPGRFSADLPPAPCGSTVQYYFEAQTTDGRTFTYPIAGAAQPLLTTAYQLSTVFADDVESVQPGWTVWNHSSLTFGAWERAIPVGSLQNGVPAAPFNAAGGQWAFITENGPPGGGPGVADVDGGPTILTSPPFDLASAAGAELSFDYWHYSVGGTLDNLEVHLSGDDGQTWVTAAIFNHATPSQWRSATLNIGQFVSLGPAVRVRFSVSDNPNNSVTESGIDNLEVRAWGCASCYANCDGSTTQPILNVEDFSCFINRFAEAQLLPAAQQVTHYANCDGSTTHPVLNVEDFSCFINQFAAGCP